ncbi:MAG: malonyl-ACP O-methyltransferase BioC [Candidatus Omnitrophica bacterium]|nr:malonyl-ACP O-methyltransferase BioC [Candidatus Omnitrophota bacterium]
MDKEAIKKNFSRYARSYDTYSTVQDHCAAGLIAKIKSNGFRKILDIGCGTGNYTRLLKERYPQASIKAVDISEEMVDVAREKLDGQRVDFLVRDAEAIDLDDEFDLISSNVSFQWFEDLKDPLSRYSGLLKESGIIAFSQFGPKTFYELNSSLRILFGKDVSISAYNFVEKDEIETLLKRHFKMVEAAEEIYRESHNSLRELLTKIRYTGTRGRGLNNGNLWTPKVINNLEDIYRERFKGITATYQVFYLKGVK